MNLQDQCGWFPGSSELSSHHCGMNEPLETLFHWDVVTWVTTSRYQASWPWKFTMIVVSTKESHLNSFFFLN